MDKMKIIEIMKNKITKEYGIRDFSIKPKTVYEYNKYYEMAYGIFSLLFDKKTGKLVEKGFIDVLDKIGNGKM